MPTFPNVFSRPDVEYFSAIGEEPATAPAEMGAFRECVAPVIEAGRADLVDRGPYRIDEFIEIEPAPGHSPGHVVFKLESKGERGAFIGDVLHHLLQVHYPDWNFPKNSDPLQARRSRHKVLDYCAATGALMFPCHGFALRGSGRTDTKRISSDFCGLTRRAFVLFPIDRSQLVR